MLTNMNKGQTQTGWASHLDCGVSGLSFSDGLAGYLWFICVLVMAAARGDYCSQITRSINKAKVPLESLN